jgi:predicted amidohydrolase YtcJ
MKYPHGLLCLVLSIMLVLSACETNEKPKANLVITNATIWTGNTEQPWAQAMAISGDTLLAVGTVEEIKHYIEDNTIVNDLNGRFVTPGFIDSHVHFLTGGFDLASVQLRDAATPEEFINRVAEFAKTVPEGNWILGGAWNHENWGGELPTKEWIDEVTPNHPVLITRLDGHMSLANSLALKMAGITSQTPDVAGGQIERTATGELTGLLRDNAVTLVGAIIPTPDEAQFSKALHAAMQYVAAKGVTSVHYMAGTTPKGAFEALKNARNNDELITRIYYMYDLENWQALEADIKQSGFGDKWLKIGGLKGFVDGSLGSHTAAFFDPYTDKPTDRGIYLTPQDSLVKYIMAADKAGLQLMVHAIGDEGIHFLLNTFEQAQKENGPRDRRMRIEHAQHIAPADIPRFAQLGIIPSMQPYHAIDDGQWAEKIIGPERIKSTYAFRSLMDANATVAFGSDWFVAPPTPLEGIYAAVTRRTLDDLNPDGWVPEQKITVEQALTAYTRNAAYASFDDHLKGSLQAGKLADFVVISEDLTKVDPVRIRDLEIHQTYVGGKKIFDSSEK